MGFNSVFKGLSLVNMYLFCKIFVSLAH